MPRALIGIDIKADLAAFRRQVEALGRKTPQLEAKLLTRLAGEARKDLRRTVGDYMVIRERGQTTGWTLSSFQFIPATPQNLHSEVGTTREYMVAQAVGDMRKGSQAIPTLAKGAKAKNPRGLPAEVKAAMPRQTIRTRTTPERHPRALLARYQDQTFVGEAGKAKTHGLWMRWTDKRTGARRIKLLYAFEKSVTVRPRWPIERLAMESVKRNWQAKVEKTIGQLAKIG